MTESLRQLLDLRPDCDVVPTHGRHKAKAVTRLMVTYFATSGIPKPVNVCKKHEAELIERLTLNGYDVIKADPPPWHIEP